jgi:hypothetical protein
MKDVTNFLTANGFRQEKHNILSNEHVDVTINEKYYEITIKKDGSYMHSDNLSIYWLIGVMTYYGWMERNYVMV